MLSAYQREVLNNFKFKVFDISQSKVRRKDLKEARGSERKWLEPTGEWNSVHVGLRRLRGGRVHIFEQLVDLASGDPAATVRNLHADVFLALHDRHLDRRDVAAVLVRLHDSPHGVLEQLEQHVI